MFNFADFENYFIVTAHTVISKYDGMAIIDQQIAWGAGNQFIVSGCYTSITANRNAQQIPILYMFRKQHLHTVTTMLIAPLIGDFHVGVGQMPLM